MEIRFIKLINRFCLLWCLRPAAIPNVCVVCVSMWVLCRLQQRLSRGVKASLFLFTLTQTVISVVLCFLLFKQRRSFGQYAVRLQHFLLISKDLITNMHQRHKSFNANSFLRIAHAHYNRSWSISEVHFWFGRDVFQFTVERLDFFNALCYLEIAAEA